MENQSIVRQVWALLEPELAGQGFELIEVEYGQFGGSYALRLFLDKENGVTLDDCEAASRQASALLDMAGLIDAAYTLEVSSPGIDRPIRKPDDFVRFSGEPVKLKTHAPVDGRKRFKGVLRGFEDGLILIDLGGETVGVHIENLKKAQLDR